MTQKIIVQGDAAATANNIMSSGLLFRLGIAGWIIVLICDAVVAWALYLFLKPVNGGLALLAAWLRLLYVATFAAGLLNLFAVLGLLGSADNVAAIESVQLHAQIMPFLAAYDSAVHVSFVPFGLHILVTGYLIFKSGNMPRILGILLMTPLSRSFGIRACIGSSGALRRGIAPLGPHPEVGSEEHGSGEGQGEHDGEGRSEHVSR